MSTTPEQKAMILDGSLERRLRRDPSVTPQSMIKFNWPSLSEAETSEVLTYYQRRTKMKVAKHVIKCALGPRRLTEKFDDTKTAKAFLDFILGKEKVTWKSSKELTAKEDALIITCEELEDIMECEEKGEISKEQQRQGEAFMRGKWPEGPGTSNSGVPHDSAKKTPVRAPRRSEAAVKTTTSSTKRPAKDGMVTLDVICTKLKLEPRKVRAAMRKAGWEKPEGGWRWATKAVPGIEKQIQQLVTK